MSDELESNTRRIRYLLMDSYDLLADVAEKLPMPIILPATLQDERWSDRRDAVERASAICYQMPGTSMAVREAFKAACLCWYAASDLQVAQLDRPKHVRNEATRMLLIQAEDYVAQTRRYLEMEG
ncbi:hypothetical protein [Streptomyces sp. NPDC002537]